MRRRIRRLGLVAVVVLVGLAALAPAAAADDDPPGTEPAAPSFEIAAERSVSVSPDADLAHLQVVQISGSGYEANESVGISQCKPGAIDVFEDCDITRSAIPSSDSAGNFTASLSVSARIRLSNSGEVVDCTKEFGACVIGVIRLATFSDMLTAPIGFDPDAIPSPPVLTVTPSSGLAHDEEVAITGSGFTPNANIQLEQCPAGGEPIPLCVSQSEVSGQLADSNGNFSTTVVVKRVFGDPDFHIVDCLSEGCVIRASSYEDPLANTDVPITFDPDAPLPPRPAATVTPDADLAHDQQLRVQGTGFVPNVGVRILECSLGRTPYPTCAYASSPFVLADQDGNVDATLLAKRVLGYAGGPTIDCLEAPGCVIRTSSDTDEALMSVEVPISFDPDAPLPPPPVLTIEPSTDLVHHQKVTLTGTGFGPHSFVEVRECAEGADGTPDAEQCWYFTDEGRPSPIVTDEHGAFTTTLRIRRLVGNPGDQPVDCLDVSGCALYAWTNRNDPLHVAELELSFDPDAPLPPPPVVTVTPSSDLPSRQNVEVEGAGFAPELQHSVAQCTTEPNIFERVCDRGSSLPTDDNGAIDVTIGVRRFLPSFAGPIDCAEPDRCAVSVHSYRDPLSDALVPISFDPNAAPVPPPVANASPSSGLKDGDTVTITGTGFSANASLGLAQCREGSFAGSLCDSPGRFFTADEDGSFSVDFFVRERINAGQAGPTDCTTASGLCIIGVGNVADFSERASASLTFGTTQLPQTEGPAAPIRIAPPPRLAFAGTPVAGYLEFGAISLGLGVMLVFAGRKRRLRV